MDINHWIQLLQISISLIQVLVWPVLTLFALLYLGRPLKNYINDLRKDKNVSEVSAELSTTGVKVNVKRQVEAALNLSLAESKSTGSPSGEQARVEVKTQEALHIASKAATSETVQQVAGARVLWVDDNPSNNVYERRALEALGIQFTLSTSTEEALEKVRANSYDVIISDMTRASDKQAGYSLLEELQKRGVHSPFIIYGGSKIPDLKGQTMRRGGFGVTNNPQELFQLVINAIQNR